MIRQWQGNENAKKQYGRFDKQINHFAQVTHFFAFVYDITAQLQYEDA